jgi:hypothetical protein
MPFQTAVNITQAPAVEGDFCDSNPRGSVQAGQGAFVAGSNGVTIGRFAWADSSLLTVANTGSGVPTGFVARTGQQTLARFSAYPPTSGMVSMLIPAGFPLTLHDSGGFWVRNAGAGAVTYGMKAFSNTTNGSASFAATGATVAGSVETKWYAKSAGAAGELIKMSNVL